MSRGAIINVANQFLTEYNIRRLQLACRNGNVGRLTQHPRVARTRSESSPHARKPANRTRSTSNQCCPPGNRWRNNASSSRESLRRRASPTPSSRLIAFFLDRVFPCTNPPAKTSSPHFFDQKSQFLKVSYRDVKDTRQKRAIVLCGRACERNESCR